DRASGDRGAGHRPEREPEEASGPEDRREAQPESPSEPRVESHHEPRAERPRSDFQRQAPVLLPGESISKYQPQGQPSSVSAPAAVKTESTPRPRPSTEYSIDPSEFSAGSMVLPGESLAKYGRQSQPSRAASRTVKHEAATPERQESGFLQDRESTGPIPRRLEEEEAQARVEVPSVLPRREAAQETPARTDEPTRFDARHAAFEEREHTARDEQRYESMNVARVFGGDASEEEEESSLEHERAEEAAPANAAIEEPPALEQHPWKAPSQGVVEEEEIEEEEMEMPGFQEDPDMTDFEEMEEEVLG